MTPLDPTERFSPPVTIAAKGAGDDRLSLASERLVNEVCERFERELARR